MDELGGRGRGGWHRPQGPQAGHCASSQSRQPPRRAGATSAQSRQRPRREGWRPFLRARTTQRAPAALTAASRAGGDLLPLRRYQGVAPASTAQGTWRKEMNPSPSVPCLGEAWEQSCTCVCVPCKLHYILMLAHNFGIPSSYVVLVVALELYFVCNPPMPGPALIRAYSTQL